MQNKNIAMLIDGDNAQPKYLKNIMEETSKHGRIIIKRIYGDWSSEFMKSWKKKLSTFSIKPIQEFAYTTGKNATDIALVIDAMDILYREKIDVFCIVSSDSDFTGLANRVRESGRVVLGIGKNQTPKSFVNACDTFIFTENFKQEISIEKLEKLLEEKPISIKSTEKETSIAIDKKDKKDKVKEKDREKGKSKKNKKKSKLKKNNKIDANFLRKAFLMAHQENGKVQLSHISHEIRRLDANFNVKKHGFKNFISMFKSFENDFETICQNNSTVLIKIKN
ncbi:NYN domain-containing protein [Tenacibaculum finnmarkense]|uniref:NYN domain-containing protein n=1 Tax=Tenacibaculum finnmarkense TaxID=2781243 RepID=UPI001E48EC95|nr:NYN domain-containing protein [Tenacibaculum finnmarkense]MCD8446042.1 NYN domain-containing protein [Tenacibaculum finnmarkense genomovar finnmarkense]